MIENRSKFYEVMVDPTSMYGSETRALTKRSQQCTESAEMRFVISVKECTRLDKIANNV
jgi:hypothetical protein